jgi:ribonuclease VapC
MVRGASPPVIFVFDASSVLAILFDEKGADMAAAHARGSCISAVNLIEVSEKFARQLGQSDTIADHIDRLELSVLPFTRSQALLAAAFKPKPQFRNVSLADRSCLAVAMDKGLPVLTADTQWSELDIGIDIHQIR